MDWKVKKEMPTSTGSAGVSGRGVPVRSHHVPMAKSVYLNTASCPSMKPTASHSHALRAAGRSVWSRRRAQK